MLEHVIVRFSKHLPIQVSGGSCRDLRWGAVVNSDPMTCKYCLRAGWIVGPTRGQFSALGHKTCCGVRQACGFSRRTQVPLQIIKGEADVYTHGAQRELGLLKGTDEFVEHLKATFGHPFASNWWRVGVHHANVILVVQTLRCTHSYVCACPPDQARTVRSVWLHGSADESPSASEYANSASNEV